MCANCVVEFEVFDVLEVVPFVHSAS